MNYLDMITKLGVGSAHPGGFEATLEQLRRFPLPQGCRVLEVGCGTGRTACHLAGLGYDITGMDLRPEMLAKARRRAEKEELTVNFVQGDITSMPFADESFDVVLAESVTNFASIAAALSEYSRVLAPGGVLYDREVMQLKPIPEPSYGALMSFFGFGGLLTADGWQEQLQANGFSEVQIWNPSEFGSNLTEDQTLHPDELQMIDRNAFLDPLVWQTTIEHDDLIQSNRGMLGYALFIGKK
ncbi:methyltransferase domain-containing protein [Paenibacillus filicis]|uniref:Methyltransferase domain-containing protein n=1 Tax=Paenibacillus gyeongsangnamensis TaxID=3388067 RepID=A0ABT4QFD4_9BACL|nr:class I SAM-dependent methyltransferase [Paenibacillus filicis]MCZ8515570.1 methyltransferase domain-containing protein [Paenibacillus filicis]